MPLTSPARVGIPRAIRWPATAACLWLLTGCALATGRGATRPRLPAGLADSVRTEAVAQGVRLHALVNTSAPWRAYVLDVDTRCATARALKGGTTAVGRTTASALLAGLAAMAPAVAAINGDFFLFSPPGVPTNLHIEGGVLLAGPGAKPVFASDGARRYALDSVRVAGMIRAPGAALVLEAWNRPAVGRSGVVDAHWGVPFDTALRHAVIQRLELVSGGAGPGPALDGRYLVRPSSTSDTLARGDTLLLHLATGALPLTPGDTVQLVLGLQGAGGPGIREAVGGRPLLVVDSVVTGDVDTEGTAAFRGLNPRSAVGMNRAGTRLWYVVIDGRQKGYSMGMTLRQTAELLRGLGATRALNLDGGGSSTLALRDPATGRVRVVNRPSDSTERPVANAIAIQATCAR